MAEDLDLGQDQGPDPEEGRRREEENEKRQNEEDRLEKPSALSNPKNQAAAESSRGGIVGWFKNFIGKIII